FLGDVEEEIARQPAGAPRRQIERGLRERERIARGEKARHQRSVEERADQRGHERRRRRDGEDAGGGGHPPILRIDSRRLNFSRHRAGLTACYTALARSALSAAAIASGVPTCIHTPSRRSPQSRPASAARSNRGDMENAPAGAPAKKAGVRIAAPAYTKGTTSRSPRRVSRPSVAMEKSPRPV